MVDGTTMATMTRMRARIVATMARLIGETQMEKTTITLRMTRGIMLATTREMPLSLWRTATLALLT